MKIHELYFSPTGGTKKVADILSGGLAEEVLSLDFTDSQVRPESLTLSREDLALLAVPSYGGRVPAAAARRLAALQGGGARAVLVCVYGNRAYEDTLLELSDLARQAGFRVVAAVAAVAQHSILPQYAAGRPDERDRRQLIEFAGQIRAALAGELPEPQLPGNRPYRKAGGAALVPKPGKGCDRCGLCARECPVQAIDPADPARVDKAACISCMRCVRLCPRSARNISPLLRAAAGLALKKSCSARKENDLFLARPAD